MRNDPTAPVADEEEEWAPASDECSACGIGLGAGRGRVARAVGSSMCLECATLYDPPTDYEICE